MTFILIDYNNYKYITWNITNIAIFDTFRTLIFEQKELFFKNYQTIYIHDYGNYWW